MYTVKQLSDLAEVIAQYVDDLETAELEAMMAGEGTSDKVQGKR